MSALLAAGAGSGIVGAQAASRGMSAIAGQIGVFFMVPFLPVVVWTVRYCGPRYRDRPARACQGNGEPCPSARQGAQGEPGTR